MNPRSWTKQPFESRYLGIDCSSALPSAVTLSTMLVQVLASNASIQATMIEGTPTFSGSTIAVQIKGGVDNTNYGVRVRLTLSNGELVEDDIILYVREEQV